MAISATADFQVPLAAHGAWIEVGTYGHCWRPAHVVGGWRPYCDGRWIWTDCGWYWESGFDRDPIIEMEYIRDWNFRAMYGAWDTLKNVDGLYPNHRLGWAAFIAASSAS